MRQLARPAVVAPLVLLACLATTGRAHAQPAYLGAEILVNTYTTGDQERPAVAATAGGGFVAAWESFANDGDNAGVMARRFGADGAALGDQFTVNTYVVLRQGSPQVSADDGGGFVVVWEGDIQDGSGYGVFGQRYDAAGAALGTEFALNTYITGDQRSPDVAVDADGDFVVVWSSLGQDGSGAAVVGRLFGSDGLPAGDEFTVNSYTSQGQYFPRVDARADGSFVVVWASYDGRDGAGYGIFGQRFDALGSMDGTEFAVNTFTTSDQRDPAVAITAAGFTVVWESDGNDGSNLGVAGRRYDAAGAPLGDEFVVNTYDLDNQAGADVAGDSAGGFAVVWDSIGLDGAGTAVIAQRFDAAGVATGAELVVNTTTAGDQDEAAVAATSDGKFIVAWSDAVADADGGAVGAQRMLVTAPKCGEATLRPLAVAGVAIAGEPAASVTATDALIVLSASVGVGECPLCLCDVNSSLSVTAVDALGVLNAAVGLDQALVCPNVCL